MKKKVFKIRNVAIWAVIVALVGVFACTDEKYEPFYSDDELLISSYFGQSEEFSEIHKILEYTGLVNAFDVYGTYTFFAPNDEAFKAYYQEKGKSAHTDFTVEELVEIVKFHVLPTQYTTMDFGEGALPDTTLTGDRLSAVFSEIGRQIQINKTTTIIQKDIVLPNGVVHMVDKVMPPLNFSVGQWVKDNADKFSIMARALEETKIDETLDSLMGYTSSGNPYRKWYTLFAIPDVILAQQGINSFEDLAEHYAKGRTDYTHKYNGVYRWLAYHLLIKSYSLANFALQAQHFGTLSNQVLQVEVSVQDGVVKLNNVADTAGVYSWVELDEPASNNAAKNGMVHVLISKLEPAEFKQVNRRFYFGDYPGIPWDEYCKINKTVRIPWPNTGDGTNSKGETMTPDMVDGVDWKNPGPYVGFDGHGITNNKISWMYMSFGGKTNYWTATWDIPTLLPGDYMIRFSYKKGGGRGTVQAFFDGEQIGAPVDMQKGPGSYASYSDITPVKIVEAKPHKFTLKIIKLGADPLGYVEFRPIQ